MSEQVEAVVIGAGIVGLACAYELSRRLDSVVIIEREVGPGREISSRNSGVIHAGIYYPSDSLKTKLCIEGNRRLYEWCEAHEVPHRRTGKLIVATSVEDEQRVGSEEARSGDRSRRPGGAWVVRLSTDAAPTREEKEAAEARLRGFAELLGPRIPPPEEAT